MTVTSYQITERDFRTPDYLNFILREIQRRLAACETTTASTASSTTDLTNTLIGIRKRLLKRSTDTDTPSSLTVAASANGMVLLFGVSVGKNAESVVEAHFRASYTNDLAVTSMNLSSPDIDASQITATSAGAIYKFTSDRPGRWYYAWRLRNEKGWGPWSSPIAAVTDYLDTKDAVDSGPPAGWTVTIEDNAADASLASNQIRVKATRPTSNGSNLLRWSWQIKDSSTGSWLALDNGAAPSGVLYDGSAINHEVLDGGTKIKRSSGTGFGTAMTGDLILLDVRGSAFNVQYTQWATISGFLDADGDPIAEGSPDAVYLVIQGFWHPQVLQNLRVKVVEPPWGWSTGGYLGNAGWGTQWIQSRPDAIFYSPPITLGNVSYSSLDVVSYFENHYCCSSASTPGGALTVSSDAVAVYDGLNTYVAGAPAGARIVQNPTDGIKVYDDGGNLWLNMPMAADGYGQLLVGVLAGINNVLGIYGGDPYNAGYGPITIRTGDSTARKGYVELTHVEAPSVHSAKIGVTHTGSDNVEILCDATYQIIDFKIGNSLKLRLGASELEVTGNIAVTGTVDGVDVAAHAAGSDAHGATGGIPGLNKANTPGSSFRLICDSDGRIGLREVVDNSASPSAPSMTSGETIFFDCPSYSGGKRYLVHYDGSNRFYTELTANIF